MSRKWTCPGCDSYTSDVRAALEGEREACPYCGLPGEVMRTVAEIGERYRESDLRDKLEAAEVRAGKAEAEVERLSHIVAQVRRQVATDD